ncbi:MAG: hypothetical protein MRJ65_02115 [Candidatus Brocadiaceae bacterium]|nr:hypothetical protein [Candidatus Brocadiaceae bacterium]
MYGDVSTLKKHGNTYTRYLLRESYREGKKVKHRTIANLSNCTTEEIGAIRLALRHKNDLSQLASIKETVSTHQGLSVGAVWAIHEIARELGIVDALGSTRMPVRCTQTGQGKLALWQVIARVIDNELAAFGYNRDGKRGKRVIVIGLLCDKQAPCYR